MSIMISLTVFGVIVLAAFAAGLLTGLLTPLVLLYYSVWHWQDQI